MTRHATTEDAHGADCPTCGAVPGQGCAWEDRRFEKGETIPTHAARLFVASLNAVLRPPRVPT